MANNVLGTKITDLEEAQAAGLTDDMLLIVEPETPPTKRSKLSTFFTWVKGKLAAWILSSYDEVMAATEAGYLVDALAVKDGFTQLNTNIRQEIKYKDKSFSGSSVAANGNTLIMGIALQETGYTPFSMTAYNCNEFGNGMAYIPIFVSNTQAAVFVHNYNGGKAFSPSGKLRIGYLKDS